MRKRDQIAAYLRKRPVRQQDGRRRRAPLCGYCKAREGIGWLDCLWLCAECVERVAGIGEAA